MSNREIAEISNTCSCISRGLTDDEIAEKDTRYPFRNLSQRDRGGDSSAQQSTCSWPEAERSRPDTPLAEWPVFLNDWELNSLAAAIKWQGPRAKVWIDARTKTYVAGGGWTRRQCRITAGMDWELLRLTKHLGLNQQERTACIRAYFEMHQELDAVCAWIDGRSGQPTEGSSVS